MSNTTNTTTTQRRYRLPRTTLAEATKTLLRKGYIIDTKTGRIYNPQGYEVGGNTYEPRVTVHLDGKKYNVRSHKLIGYCLFGPEALHRGIQVRHKNGNRFDNRGKNLFMVRTRAARRMATAA